MTGRMDGMGVVRIPAVMGDRGRMADYLATVSYSPELPDGWPVDEHGLPVVEPSGDEEPDELL